MKNLLSSTKTNTLNTLLIFERRSNSEVQQSQEAKIEKPEEKELSGEEKEIIAIVLKGIDFRPPGCTTRESTVKAAVLALLRAGYEFEADLVSCTDYVPERYTEYKPVFEVGKKGKYIDGTEKTQTQTLSHHSLL